MSDLTTYTLEFIRDVHPEYPLPDRFVDYETAARLAQELADYETLRRAVNESPAECGPQCGEHGHMAGCPAVSTEHWLVAQQREIDRLREALDNERASDVHTCNDRCQRVACVQRREIDRLRRELNCICTPTEARADCPAHARYCSHGHLIGQHECGETQGVKWDVWAHGELARKSRELAEARGSNEKLRDALAHWDAVRERDGAVGRLVPVEDIMRLRPLVIDALIAAVREYLSAAGDQPTPTA